jgi:hypothetical protein
LQQYYPPHESQDGPGGHRPSFRRPPWLFWLLLALSLPLAVYLLALAVQMLISLVLLFWLVGDLCMQVLIWLFGPYLLPIGLCVLALLLYEQADGGGPHFPEGAPRDGDY